MLVDCGGELYVGDVAACNSGGFTRTVHVWRGRDLRDKATCRHVATGTGDGLAVQWREEESLADLGPQLAAIRRYAEGPGRLLIHCRSGHCRSTNLAVYAAVVRGLDPFDTMDRINRSRFDQVQGVPAWRWEVINEILNLHRRIVA